MNFQKLLFITDPFKALEGVEEDLQKRKLKGRLALYAAIAGAVLQLLIALQQKDFFTNARKFIDSVRHFRISPIGSAEFLLIALTAIAFIIYLLYRKTRVFLKESKEPFRYTFGIDAFKEIKETPGERFELVDKDQFSLLHLDLKEFLNSRVKRFSLLENIKEEQLAALKTDSHFQITGEYCIRKDRKGDWIVHVMPKLKMGNKRTEKIIGPIKYQLNFEDPEDKKAKNKDVLTHTEYYQIAERVFSKIVSEVYHQIKKDLSDKIELFPTSYLKAVALYNEAYDFEESNTIDAYDNAINIYEQANELFKTRMSSLLINISVNIPFIWKWLIKSKLYEVNSVIGKSRCMLYRYIMASYSGRSNISLFSIPLEINRTRNVLDVLEKRLNNSWYIKLVEAAYNRLYATTIITGNEKAFSFPTRQKRKKKSWAVALFAPVICNHYKKHRQLKRTIKNQQCECFTVLAWSYRVNGSNTAAEKALSISRNIIGTEWNKDRFWLIAASQVANNSQEINGLLTKTLELDPNFEIPQFLLAKCKEDELRKNEEINSAKVQLAIDEYEKALKLNPSNIGALTAQGFLYWLIKRPKEAKEKYQEGIDVKTNVSETYIGELLYGLARVEAEDESEDVTVAVQLFEKAIKSEPSIAAYTPGISRASITPVFDYIGRDLYTRFQNYLDNINTKVRRKFSDGTQPDSLHKVFLSYVLNDVGNAALNLAYRTEIPLVWEQAYQSYSGAIEFNRNNAIANYNMFQLSLFRPILINQPNQYLDHCQFLLPQWLNAFFESHKKAALELEFKVNDLKQQLRATEEEYQQIIAKITEKEQLYNGWGTRSSDKEGIQISSFDSSENQQNSPLNQRIQPEDSKELEVKPGAAVTNNMPAKNLLGSLAKGGTEELIRLYKNKGSYETRLEKIKEKLKAATSDLQDETLKTINELLEKTFFRIPTLKLKDRTGVENGQSNANLNQICESICALLRGNNTISEITESDFNALIYAASMLKYNVVNDKNLINQLDQLYELLFNISEENLDINLDWFDLRKKFGLTGKKDTLLIERINKIVNISLKGDTRNLNIYSWISIMRLDQLLVILNEFKSTRTDNEVTDPFRDKSTLFFIKDPVEDGLKKTIEITKATFSTDEKFNSVGSIADCFIAKICNIIVSRVNDFIQQVQPWLLNSESFDKLNDDVSYAFSNIPLANSDSNVTFLKEFIDINCDIHQHLNHELWKDFRLELWMKLKGMFLDIITNEGNNSTQNSDRPSVSAQYNHQLFVHICSALNKIPFHGIEEDLSYIINQYLELERNEELRQRLVQEGFKQIYFNDSEPYFLETTPIRIYLSPELLPAIIDQNYKLHKKVIEAIEEARKEMRNKYSVKLPNVLFSEHYGVTGKQFVIMIKEVPFVWVGIPAGKKHTTLSPSKLDELKISYEIATTNPGAAGSNWIDQEFEVDENLAPYIHEDADYVIWFLKEYMASYLWQFVGFEETTNLINSETLDPPTKSYLLDNNNLNFVLQVLRSVLREQVPVRDCKELFLIIFNMLKADIRNVGRIINNIRLTDTFIDVLPGNNEECDHFLLDEEDEELMSKYLVTTESGEDILFIDPTDCQTILATIRNLTIVKTKPCLVVRKERLRIPFFELTKSEFPFMPVISKAEVLPYLLSKIEKNEIAG